MKEIKLKSGQIIGVILITVVCILIGFIFRSCLNSQVSNYFCVLSTTDMHARVWDYDIQTKEPTPANMLSAATVIKKTQQEFGERTIAYDNGDLYQGSLIKAYESEVNNVPDPKGVNDLDPCTICLDDLKYDAFTLGNHEFNYKYSLIKTNYEYIKENTTLLAANVYEKNTNNRLFKPYITKTVKADGHFLKIGIIGLENPECSLWDASDYTADVSMHSVENPNADLSYEIKKVQDEMALADEKCDFVIVSMHNGFFKQDEFKNATLNKEIMDTLNQRASEPLVEGKNTEDQAYRAIKNTTGIDMFITGHDHSEIYSNRTFSNLDNSKEVLVVNGGSESITKSVFEANYDENEHCYHVVLNNSENIKLAETPPDEGLRSKIRPYIDNEIQNYALQPGKIVGKWIKSDYVEDYYKHQTDELDLINRAQMWAGYSLSLSKAETLNAVNKKLKARLGDDTKIQFSGPEILPDISITPASVDGQLKPVHNGEFTYEDAKSLYPEDHYLCAIAVTGEEIKRILENNAENSYELIYNEKGNKDIKIIGDPTMCLIPYGLSFYYDMAAPVGNRVVIDRFSNGKEFNKDEVYCMMVNSYILENFSNFLEEDIIRNRAIIDQDLNYNGTYLRHVIDIYATRITTEYGGVYPTLECKKDNEVPSIWYISY